MSFWTKIFFSPKRRQQGKMKLYSMRRVNDKSIFKLEKKQVFYRNFREILKNLGFEDVETWHYNPSYDQEFPIYKLNNFVDTFKSKNCDVDVIFTQDRIIVILRGPDAIRAKFVDGLMTFCEWFESKPLNPIVRKNF
jgi:hypothetical protein